MKIFLRAISRWGKEKMLSCFYKMWSMINLFSTRNQTSGQEILQTTNFPLIKAIILFAKERYRSTVLWVKEIWFHHDNKSCFFFIQILSESMTLFISFALSIHTAWIIVVEIFVFNIASLFSVKKQLRNYSPTLFHLFGMTYLLKLRSKRYLPKGRVSRPAQAECY